MKGDSRRTCAARPRRSRCWWERSSARGARPGQACPAARGGAPGNLPWAGPYRFQREGRVRTLGQVVEYYATLAAEFPIRSIEDGLGERDWASWQIMAGRLGGAVEWGRDEL